MMLAKEMGTWIKQGTLKGQQWPVNTWRSVQLPWILKRCKSKLH
jgi:hypothetical protein